MELRGCKGSLMKASRSSRRSVLKRLLGGRCSRRSCARSTHSPGRACKRTEVIWASSSCRAQACAPSPTRPRASSARTALTLNGPSLYAPPSPPKSLRPSLPRHILSTQIFLPARQRRSPRPNPLRLLSLLSFPPPPLPLRSPSLLFSLPPSSHSRLRFPLLLFHPSPAPSPNILSLPSFLNHFPLPFLLSLFRSPLLALPSPPSPPPGLCFCPTVTVMAGLLSSERVHRRHLHHLVGIDSSSLWRGDSILVLSSDLQAARRRLSQQGAACGWSEQLDFLRHHARRRLTGSTGR